jgi:hypothetical protein
MRLVRWFSSAWADAKKSGEWMADAPWPRGQPPLSRWARWNFRTQPRFDMVAALMFLAVPLLITILVLVVLLIFLVTLLIEALT